MPPIKPRRKHRHHGTAKTTAGFNTPGIWRTSLEPRLDHQNIGQLPQFSHTDTPPNSALARGFKFHPPDRRLEGTFPTRYEARAQTNNLGYSAGVVCRLRRP